MQCDHSLESYLTIISCGSVCVVVPFEENTFPVLSFVLMLI